MTAEELRTDREGVQRAGYSLSAAAAAATLFAFAPSSDAVRFVVVSLPVVVVLLVIALLGLSGARTGRPVLLGLAAGVGVLASVLQLLQFGRSTNWLGGNGSTAAFLAALGIGFCALWYAGRHGAVPARQPGAGGHSAS